MQTTHSILLVEDDKEDQEFFLEALSTIENAVLYDVANNGYEALIKLDNQDSLPTLIFMDIKMPVMDGIECLKAIVQMQPVNNIPVIILSDYIDKIELTRQLGAKAFIKKPWSVKMLRRQIEQMVNLDFNAYHRTANQTFNTVHLAFLN